MYIQQFIHQPFSLSWNHVTFHQFSIHPTLTSLSSICHIFIHGKLTNGGIELWQDNIAKLPHISQFTQLDFDHTLNPNPKP